MFFLLEEQNLSYPFICFSKTKGKSLREVVFFIEKKNNKGEMGNPKRRKPSVYLEKIKKRANIFKTSQQLV